MLRSGFWGTTRLLRGTFRLVPPPEHHVRDDRRRYQAEEAADEDVDGHEDGGPSLQHQEDRHDVGGVCRAAEDEAVLHRLQEAVLLYRRLDRQVAVAERDQPQESEQRDDLLDSPRVHLPAELVEERVVAARLVQALVHAHSDGRGVPPHVDDRVYNECR